MKYEEELKQTLINPHGNVLNQWISDTSHLSEMLGIADDSIEKNTSEGKIAALFIYHQLTFEMMKYFLIAKELYIKVSVFPIHYTSRVYKNGDSYSKVRSELSYGISFKGKEKLISLSKDINDLRNEFGHDLLKNLSFYDIEDNLKDVRVLFQEFFTLFGQCQNELASLIDHAKERDQIQELINS